MTTSRTNKKKAHVLKMNAKKKWYLIDGLAIVLALAALVLIYQETRDTGARLIIICATLILVVWIGTLAGGFGFLPHWGRKWPRSPGDDARSGTSTEHYETAFIATNLVPHLERFLSDSESPEACTLVITGGDCYPLGEEHYPWVDFLQKILDQGRCQIIQYTSHGRHGVQNILEDLRAKHPKHFEYRQFANPGTLSDPEERELVDAFQTFHPTLAWKGNGGESDEKLMWIERYHPYGSTEAYGCDYYDSDALKKNSEDFDLFRKKLEEAWDISKRVANQRGGDTDHLTRAS